MYNHICTTKWSKLINCASFVSLQKHFCFLAFDYQSHGLEQMTSIQLRANSKHAASSVCILMLEKSKPTQQHVTPYLLLSMTLQLWSSWRSIILKYAPRIEFDQFGFHGVLRIQAMCWWPGPLLYFMWNYQAEGFFNKCLAAIVHCTQALNRCYVVSLMVQ